MFRDDRYRLFGWRDGDFFFKAFVLCNPHAARPSNRSEYTVLAVEVEKYEETDKLLRIEAVIWVEREGQKGIVVGAGGESLKGVGTAARRDMEHAFGRKVFLQLWVKVRGGWADDEARVRSFGYE